MRNHQSTCPRAGGNAAAPCWCWEMWLRLAWHVVMLLVLAYFVVRANYPNIGR